MTSSSEEHLKFYFISPFYTVFRSTSSHETFHRCSRVDLYTWYHAGLMTIGLLLAGAQITLFHFYYQLDNLGRFEYLYGLLTIFWLHFQNLLDALSRALDPQHAYEWSRINQESGGIAEIFYRLENYLDLLTRNLDSMQKNPYRVVSKHIGKYQQ